MAHKNLDSVPSLVEKKKKKLATRTVWVEFFLIWLENSPVMTPDLKGATYIEQSLERIARPNIEPPRLIVPLRRTSGKSLSREDRTVGDYRLAVGHSKM